MQLSRRRTLYLGLGALASLAASTSCSTDQVHLVQSRDDFESSPANTDALSLKERAAAKGLIYGASARFQDFQSDATIPALYERECSIFVPGQSLKWMQLRPNLDEFDFSQGDWMADFAQGHGMLFRGHTLVWNQAIPPWVREYATRQNAVQLMVDHITTVVKHYAGRMHSWDVVNEALQLGEPNNLKQSLWRNLIGPEYIELAFRAAAEADPETMLVFNENRFEYESQDADARRTAMLELLADLQGKGTPIHALGIQGHLRGNLNHDINGDRFREFLRDVANLGLKILITELDVADKYLPSNIDDRDRIVAAAYEEYLSVVLDEPAVIAVITWGLSDRYTWLSKYAPREDGLPVRPLPLDEQLNRKPAWDAIARTFDQAPVRQG